MPNKYYDEIQMLSGLDEVKQIVEKWENLSKNMQSAVVEHPILLPEMLWISKSGVGKTLLLRLMSEYLFLQKNVMEFYGSVKFFEFYIEYCSPGSEFSELRRFIDTVHQAAGFRSEYKGLICINIDDWIGHEEDKHFITLMEYLSSNSSNWFIVFCVVPRKGMDIYNTERILSMFFRLDKVTVDMPETGELVKHLRQQLTNYKLEMSASAESILTETIDTLRENEYFDGYKTLRMLCQDIAYSVYTMDSYDKEIGEQIASLFSKDSDYIKRTIQRFTSKNAIGFGR